MTIPRISTRAREAPRTWRDGHLPAAPFERPGMTEEKFTAFMAKQMPDAEKRRRADFIVDSSQSFDHARAQVRDILRAVAKMRPERR